MSATREQCCLHCSHFRNSPRYLESAIPGLTIMGSAYASVRKDDGICLLRDLYLSADACCEAFEAATLSAPGSRPPGRA